MNIQNRINIFMFVMLALLIVPIVSVGYIIIDEITYRLNEEGLTRELNNINTKIRDAYKDLEVAGFLENAGEVVKAQQHLLEKLSNYKFGKTGYLYILDRQSRVILHKDYQAGERFNFDFVQQMLKQNTGTLQYVYQEKTHFCVFLTSIQWNWLLVLTINKEEIFGDRASYVQFVLIFCGFIFFCVLLLSSLLTKGTSKKIDTTLYYLKQFESGSFDVHIPIISQDEIGTIQTGINAMIAKVAVANRSMLHEIEQRKRIEEELRHQEELLRQTNLELNHFKTTLDLTLDSVFMLDAQTLRFFYVNQGAINQFGYSEAELLQMTIHDLNPQFTEETTHEFLSPLIRGELPALRIETVHRHQNNTLIQVESFLQYISIPSSTDSSQGGALFVEIVRDITERKQAEAKLQQAKEAAEQAQRIAESANRAKSTFLANMSHELRTPLNGILGYTQILRRDKKLTPKQLEGIQIIHRSGEHLLTLINDVLDLSKIEAGKLELLPSDFRFPDFLKNIADLFKMQADQKHIKFVYEEVSVNHKGDKKDLPLAIHADEKRLRQILLNLLSNAVKFTKDGQVTLKVSYCQGKCYFAVEDTGAGIAEDQREVIFLPFQQANNPKTLYVEGTGLGLSISKKLVEMMGGQLQIRSELGKGSTFGFEVALPAVAGFTDNSHFLQPTIVGYQPPIPHQVFKILVVDDKLENRIFLTNFLTDLGFNVSEAENGVEALKMAHETLPDVIITDLVMPVMDGFELAREIRQAEDKLKDVVMFAASASVFEYHQNESLKAGCNEFIAKPIRAEILLDLLPKYLPLEWIYDVEETSLIETASASSTATTLVAPTPEQAKVLFDLIMRGNIKKIIENIDQLSHQEAKLVPFAEEIRKMAKKFEIAKLKEFIKPYI
jgi:PAS domain S-box-containing protein